MTRRRHTTGFSLFELLIVIGIIGVVSAVAIPRYSGSIDNYRASFAARKVAADLAFAQSAARATSESRTVTFNEGTGVYVISGSGNVITAANSVRVNLRETPFHAGFKATFGAVPVAQVTFDGFGRPDNAGTVEVTSGRATRRITLHTQSGACTIQ